MREGIQAGHLWRQMEQLTGQQRIETPAQGGKCNCDSAELKLQDLLGGSRSQTRGGVMKTF
jgi:hypothetical protein